MLAKFHRNILNMSENIAKSFRGFTFFDSHCTKVLHGVKNIAENFNRLSRVHERYRRQTDDRQTDGHIANAVVKLWACNPT